MGDWNTLHLFNEEIFYNQTVPLLKGKSGNLEKEYLNFLKYHVIGGIDRLSKQQLEELCKKGVLEVIEVSTNFDYKFMIHEKFMLSEEEEREEYLRTHGSLYDFDRFFEYIVFATCADYFPWYRVGKWGIDAKVEMRNRSIGYEVLSKLAMRSEYNLFCYDGMGIISWITSEEAELLLTNYHNLSREDEYTKDFKKYLQIVVDNKLGLLTGVDLQKYMVKELNSYKLSDQNIWKDSKLQFLNYDL